MYQIKPLSLVGSFVFVIGLTACAGETGPPDEVSREYAIQLLTENPRQPADGVTLSRAMADCLIRENYLDFSFQFRIAGRGHEHFDKLRLGAFSKFGTVYTNVPVTLSNISIQGIQSPKPDAKIIEYTAKHSFGGLENETGCMSPVDDEMQTAVAKKYDDGWRIKHVLVRKEGQF